jgi:8-oxo-dGTP diphosphatase
MVRDNFHVEVAAGVLTDPHNRVLLMQRLPGKHLAGLWEFPGGKLEAGETIEAALARELDEELGIEAHSFAPVISIPWRYPEKFVRLHALRVTGWHGEPRAREGNPLRWTALDEIDATAMPPADAPILAALRLPPYYAISPPEMVSGTISLLQGEGAMPADPEIVPDTISRGLVGTLWQLRIPEAGRDEIWRAARRMLAVDPTLGGRLLINHDIELARELGVGVHLRAAQLRELETRPLPREAWVGASCHGTEELERAARLGADFATLSPVRATASHPDAQPLGWDRFAQLVADAQLPVYALGGIGPDDLERARVAGAQGVAGIRAFQVRL